MLAPYRVIRVLLDKDAEGFRPYKGQTDKFGNEILDRECNSSDYDRELVLEKHTRMVAKVVSNYLKKHNLRYDKAIFFCVDTNHADRMRQVLVNKKNDLVKVDERYVMRITGNDDIGKKQIDNFRDVSSRYPVLVTTSKLLTTGVDVQMVKFIVLDANINSMTEFKQIIGRGTRVREDLGKMFFTIFDFRDATRCLPILTLTDRLSRMHHSIPVRMVKFRIFLASRKCRQSSRMNPTLPKRRTKEKVSLDMSVEWNTMSIMLKLPFYASASSTSIKTANS